MNEEDSHNDDYYMFGDGEMKENDIVLQKESMNNMNVVENEDEFGDFGVGQVEQQNHFDQVNLLGSPFNDNTVYDSESFVTSSKNDNFLNADDDLWMSSGFANTENANPITINDPFESYSSDSESIDEQPKAFPDPSYSEEKSGVPVDLENNVIQENDDAYDQAEYTNKLEPQAKTEIVGNEDALDDIEFASESEDFKFNSEQDKVVDNKDALDGVDFASEQDKVVDNKDALDDVDFASEQDKVVDNEDVLDDVDFASEQDKVVDNEDVLDDVDFASEQHKGRVVDNEDTPDNVDFIAEPDQSVEENRDAFEFESAPVDNEIGSDDDGEPDEQEPFEDAEISAISTEPGLETDAAIHENEDSIDFEENFESCPVIAKDEDEEAPGTELADAPLDLEQDNTSQFETEHMENVAVKEADPFDDDDEFGDFNESHAPTFESAENEQTNDNEDDDFGNFATFESATGGAENTAADNDDDDFGDFADFDSSPAPVPVVTPPVPTTNEFVPLTPAQVQIAMERLIATWSIDKNEEKSDEMDGTFLQKWELSWDTEKYGQLLTCSKCKHSIPISAHCCLLCGTANAGYQMGSTVDTAGLITKCVSSAISFSSLCVKSNAIRDELQSNAELRPGLLLGKELPSYCTSTDANARADDVSEGPAFEQAPPSEPVRSENDVSDTSLKQNEFHTMQTNTKYSSTGEIDDLPQRATTSVIVETPMEDPIPFDGHTSVVKDDAVIGIKSDDNISPVTCVNEGIQTLSPDVPALFTTPVTISAESEADDGFGIFSSSLLKPSPRDPGRIDYGDFERFDEMADVEDDGGTSTLNIHGRNSSGDTNTDSEEEAQDHQNQDELVDGGDDDYLNAFDDFAQAPPEPNTMNPSETNSNPNGFDDFGVFSTSSNIDVPPTTQTTTGDDAEYDFFQDFTPVKPSTTGGGSSDLLFGEVIVSGATVGMMHENESEKHDTLPTSNRLEDTTSKVNDDLGELPESPKNKNTSMSSSSDDDVAEQDLDATFTADSSSESNVNPNTEEGAGSDMEFGDFAEFDVGSSVANNDMAFDEFTGSHTLNANFNPNQVPEQSFDDFTGFGLAQSTHTTSNTNFEEFLFDGDATTSQAEPVHIMAPTPVTTNLVEDDDDFGDFESSSVPGVESYHDNSNDVLNTVAAVGMGLAAISMTTSFTSENEETIEEQLDNAWMEVCKAWNVDVCPIPQYQFMAAKSISFPLEPVNIRRVSKDALQNPSDDPFWSL